MAIFVYSQYGGIVQEFIEGPCDVILNTDNLPVLSEVIGLAYDGGSPFQAEVYFINLARIIQVKFGVPFFDVYDSHCASSPVSIAVRGTIGFCISDYREFIKLHRLNSFTLEDFQRQIRDVVVRYVKDTIIKTAATNNIPVIQMEAKITEINDILEQKISTRLQEDFGVTVSKVDIGAIEVIK